jgi:hypothetical protein
MRSYDSVRRMTMLQILRQVAISRVNTVLAGFGSDDLDRWIMTTGYVAGGAPQIDTADLFYVYAASITNAGGPKPPFDKFGTVIREGMRQFISGDGRVAKPNDIEIAKSCLPYLTANPLGGNFATDMENVANGRPARRMLSGLLKSVGQFAQWLQHYDGKASILHEALTVPAGSAPAQAVFGILRSLHELPWMGIATAANFVKDSQMPGLRDHHTPRSVSRVLAGWFAKPDLHVARLMAYITGRCLQPNGQPGGLGWSHALGLFRLPPFTNFSGAYPYLISADGPAIRVISDVHEWATTAETSALEIDRVLYLIGVREAVVDGAFVSAPWYQIFVNAVDDAVNQGTLRKS